MSNKWFETCSRLVVGGSLISNLAASGMAAPTQAENKKPNILVIWGDDIGTWNISHNSRGRSRSKAEKFWNER